MLSCMTVVDTKKKHQGQSPMLFYYEVLLMMFLLLLYKHHWYFLSSQTKKLIREHRNKYDESCEICFFWFDILVSLLYQHDKSMAFTIMISLINPIYLHVVIVCNVHDKFMSSLSLVLCGNSSGPEGWRYDLVKMNLSSMND